MKKHHLIALLICLAAAAAGVWWAHRPRPLPVEECSKTYRQYAGVEGIQAAYIRNFQVNDTIFVDVTTLKATTDSAWNLLRKDFHIKPTSKTIQKILDSGKDPTTIRLCSNKDPHEPMDTINIHQNHLLAFTRKSHTLSIFHTHNEAELDAVRYYNLFTKKK
jgi:hypothetical protein